MTSFYEDIQEILTLILHEQLRTVRKASVHIHPRSTVCMLSRLLQIEDRCDSKALELSRIQESEKVLLAMLSEEQNNVTYNDHIPVDFYSNQNNPNLFDDFLLMDHLIWWAGCSKNVRGDPIAVETSKSSCPILPKVVLTPTSLWWAKGFKLALQRVFNPVFVRFGCVLGEVLLTVSNTMQQKA